MKQEDKEPLRKIKKNIYFTMKFTNDSHFGGKKTCVEIKMLTCNELNTAKIYRNGRECVLTARTPKIQEMPSIGRSTATALAVSLRSQPQTNQIYAHKL